jgi:GH15 family glucan-1,4-alpha-glucosidase
LGNRVNLGIEFINLANLWDEQTTLIIGMPSTLSRATAHTVATDQPPRIDDYGVIGDCRSTALVSRSGSIDWLCWPRYDSSAIFAAIVDLKLGGRWSISPVQPFASRRSYHGESNVLETEFMVPDGRATLTDLMPVASEEFKQENLVPDHELLRQIVCTEGEIEIDIDFVPRAFYGCRPVSIRDAGSHGLRMNLGRGTYWLRSNIPLALEQHRESFKTRLTLKRGEIYQFSLSYSEDSPAVLPALGVRAREAIARSIAWWTAWAAKSKYNGPYHDAVIRSALALKLLAYAPSGAVIAAATTSLPERIGDNLNWDYRYCWLRDASLTVRTLLGLGYIEEAESFLGWLLHATRLTQPELRILYTVFGEIAPRERGLEWLQGYFDSRPVRIGNDARHQLQLDVYGEVIEATAQYVNATGNLSRSTRNVLTGLGKYVAQHWDSPDEGIWEPRSGRRNNTYSRLMCWTAMDRLVALIDKRNLTGMPRDLFLRERERIRKQIEVRAWNEHLQSYVGVLDGDKADATLLRIPWYGFEKSDTDRMRKTFRTVEQKLGTGGGLLYRYHRRPQEGAFGICGFWAVEYLALGGGTIEEAHGRMESLLKYGNDLGLFAEEIDPHSGNALGNFPQAFTHVGLVSAALTMEEKERGQSHPAVHTGSDVSGAKW